MSWIKTIAEEDAPEPLATLYDRVRDPSNGALDNIMSIHSLHAAGLEAHFDLYITVMRPTSSLRKTEREMIALVVSCINACHY